MKNGGWLDSIPQAQNGIKSPNVQAQDQYFQEKNKEGEDYEKFIGNTGEELIDFTQRFIPGLKYLPGIGSSFAVGEAEAYNQDPSLSDELGMIPNRYAQLASLMLLEAEVEKENMHKFAKNKDKGKDLTELVPEKEVNPKVIDNTYVPKPKVEKLKETKKETKSKQVPYKEQREVNKVEIDKTRTTKSRIDNNYKPETKPEIQYKFNMPNISYRDDSFVMPNEFNDIKIDNTYVAKPKYNSNLKNGGWLDNYNDYEVSAPEGFQGDGYSNVGRNSSPAWGGQFQMGGVMPGAVGHMYARHGSPSKGPRRNQTDVTDASAQNGQEMQYYREGLDFQPKTISKNGGWLDSYDKAQNGETVKYGTPEYEKAYNRGEVITKEGVRSPILLDEVVIQNNYKRPRGFWEQYKDKIVEENKDAGVLGAIIGTPISAITSLPQLAATYAFTDKVQRPSEAMDIQNPYGAMAVDAIADPANLIGANILTKENALSKLGKISTSIAPELRQGVNTNGFLDIFKSKKPKTSFAENTTNVSKNLEDLTHAKDWAKQYGYELPENLERIAQSDELTNRTVRGMMNRHNTFVRGVSTNWDELAQRNPEILRHLEGKGIDWQNNPKAAAEYMATHVPIQTGYGRASLNQDVFNQGLDAIYTSNSIPTAEGYTYGQGYITKVKKPTDFSSLDRKEWITQNSPTYHDGALEKSKITYSIKDKDVTKILGNFDTDLNIQRKFVNAQKSKKKLKEFKDEVLKEWEDDLEFYNNNPKFHGGNKEEILKNIKDVKETDFSKIKINENTNNDKITHKLLRTEKTSEEKAYKSFIDDVILNAEKNKSIVNDDVARKLSKELYNKNLEVYPSWKPGAEGIKNAKLFRQHFLNDIQNSDSDVLKELLNKHIGSANYAHYLHLGTPGEKILEPVKSWEITPDIWKNKSRAHTNTYSKKLSAMEEGGVIKDDRGQWDHPNKITRIKGGNITMKPDPRTGKALTQPILGISNTGERKMMYPGQDYQFAEGTKHVTEIPKSKLAQNGMRQEQKSLQNLDNLTNFTNYNKPQPGGWLNKYN
jgi:hypothetical protein